MGGMLFGFLFKSPSITYGQAFSYIGVIVVLVSLIVLLTRFARAKAVDTPVTILEPLAQ
ncbi:hypothetical protein LWM68_06545 [Niabella sp. W65]|nr:hypothetical protein [Niabella sp. W65]MCH7362455.1 hypothetical protein [Niabella sp. W65]